MRHPPYCLEIVRTVFVVDGKEREADYELCSCTKVRFRSESEILTHAFTNSATVESLLSTPTMVSAVNKGSRPSPFHCLAVQ